MRFFTLPILFLFSTACSQPASNAILSPGQVWQVTWHDKITEKLTVPNQSEPIEGGQWYTEEVTRPDGTEDTLGFTYFKDSKVQYIEISNGFDEDTNEKACFIFFKDGTDLTELQQGTQLFSGLLGVGGEEFAATGDATHVREDRQGVCTIQRLQ